MNASLILIEDLQKGIDEANLICKFKKNNLIKSLDRLHEDEFLHKKLLQSSFHIEQKLIEQDLKQKIPSFLKLKDKTSGAVQSQYEENPKNEYSSNLSTHKKIKFNVHHF